MSLTLKIISPEKIEYIGEAESVKVPGSSGEFEILSNHAPIISSLVKGKVKYVSEKTTHTLNILGGFVEVQKNEVNLCVEL